MDLQILQSKVVPPKKALKALKKFVRVQQQLQDDASITSSSSSAIASSVDGMGGGGGADDASTGVPQLPQGARVTDDVLYQIQLIHDSLGNSNKKK
jgi:hypothetical protein